MDNFFANRVKKQEEYLAALNELAGEDDDDAVMMNLEGSYAVQRRNLFINAAIIGNKEQLMSLAKSLSPFVNVDTLALAERIKVRVVIMKLEGR